MNRPGAFAELIALPMTNIWHHWPGVDEDVAAIFDPFGNAVHTALCVPRPRRGRAHHRRRPDRVHGGGGRAPRRRAPRRRHRRRTPTGSSSPSEWAPRLTVDPGAARPRGRAGASSGMTEGFDVGLEMSGNARGAPRDDREHGPRRPHRHARHPDRGGRDRLDPGGLQHADAQGDLRPRDVRDLVPDDGDAAVGARHRSGDHPPLPYTEFEEGFAVAGSGRSGKVILDWTEV